MAEQQELRVQLQRATDGTKSLFPQKGPSTYQVLAVVTLFPLGGLLLILAGLTLTGTLIGCAIATPLFVIFSPVLVPAALTLGLAVAGFLTSGAFGLTALSSLSYIVNYFRGTRGSVSEQMEHVKRRAQDTAGQLGQRTREMGQGVQQKAQEGGRT
ncbi:hypothetical protein L1049_028466 [Liquidambar formosana]|uniref:Oleosin n=1 Tax=Liquidambar formosana TaxID=63359 RepID=A0AAP0RIS6_LIQFO